MIKDNVTSIEPYLKINKLERMGDALENQANFYKTAAEILRSIERIRRIILTRSLTEKENELLNEIEKNLDGMDL